MVQVTARAHTVALCGPLRVPTRADLATVYEMLYDDLATRLTTTDEGLLQRLTSPESPEFLGDRSDFCAHVTYLLVTGTVT
jgi:hypothetical protein